MGRPRHLPQGAGRLAGRGRDGRAPRPAHERLGLLRPLPSSPHVRGHRRAGPRRRVQRSRAPRAPARGRCAAAPRPRASRRHATTPTRTSRRSTSTRPRARSTRRARCSSASIRRVTRSGSQELAVLVEGNFDVVSLHARGITNVVASLGTAFTTEQAKLLKRFAPDVVFLLRRRRRGSQGRPPLARGRARRRASRRASPICRTASIRTSSLARRASRRSRTSSPARRACSRRSSRCRSTRASRRPTRTRSRRASRSSRSSSPRRTTRSCSRMLKGFTDKIAGGSTSYGRARVRFARSSNSIKQALPRPRPSAAAPRRPRGKPRDIRCKTAMASGSRRRSLVRIRAERSSLNSSNGLRFWTIPTSRRSSLSSRARA